MTNHEQIIGNPFRQAFESVSCHNFLRHRAERLQLTQPQSVFLFGEVSFLRVWFRASTSATRFKHKRSATILGYLFLVHFQD